MSLQTDVPMPFGAVSSYLNLILHTPSPSNLAQLHRMQPKDTMTGYIRTSAEAAKWVRNAGQFKDVRCVPLMFFEDAMRPWLPLLDGLASPESVLVYVDEKTHQDDCWWGRAYRLADLTTPEQFLVQGRCRDGFHLKSYDGPAGLQVPITTALHLLHEPHKVKVTSVVA